MQTLIRFLVDGSLGSFEALVAWFKSVDRQGQIYAASLVGVKTLLIVMFYVYISSLLVDFVSSSLICPHLLLLLVVVFSSTNLYQICIK